MPRFSATFSCRNKPEKTGHNKINRMASGEQAVDILIWILARNLQSQAKG
jgi:hypothetical protein